MHVLGQEPGQFCQLGQQPGLFHQFGDFQADARQAIQVAPDYFVWWYTVKSVGLGVAVAALAFVIGRATVKR
jgi:hypothetical protein